MENKEHLKTKLNKRAVIEQLEQNLGVVSHACKAVGIGRTQFYNWMKEDPEFKKEVEEIEGIALDFVESQLFKQIKDNNVQATMFYLRCKGKRRGYSESLDVTTGGDKITEVKVNIVPPKEQE